LSSLLGILSKGEETTIVLQGVEHTTNALLELAYNTKERMDVCADWLAPSVSIGVPELKSGMIDMVRRGVKYRYVTEITKDNLSYCKELAKYAELRHLDGIRGNFVVNESHYLATAIIEKEAKPVPEIIYSSVRSIVEQHQYLFLTLWDKAIPGENRIREIEGGIEAQRILVIYDGRQALELYQSLIMSTEKETKVVFPTTNAVIRQDKAGILFLLQEVADAKKCKVKILMPDDESIRNFVRNNSNVSTRFIDREASGKATILIVDNRVSLVMELKDDSKKTFHEAIGVSTYSNSKAGVLSYVSMFESLWKQSQLYEELKNSEKMQKEFINIAAHELRTPTQAILGYAELGQTEGSGVNKEEALSKILRNAERLQRLTEDILDVTRIESQTLKLNKTKVDLRDIAASVLDNFKNRIQDGKNVKFVLSDADKSALVVADKERVSQVLSNLVTNALKFTTIGTISISIDEEVNIDENKKEFIVSVKDTGTGIDSEVIPRLFTKFVSKSQTGTGLGLYISKNIVEALGGRIWAENNADGKGATFRFSLPIG
jgi:two-component system sensor histidine kinase VicK